MRIPFGQSDNALKYERSGPVSCSRYENDRPIGPGPGQRLDVFAKCSTFGGRTTKVPHQPRVMGHLTVASEARHWEQPEGGLPGVEVAPIAGRSPRWK